MPWKDVPDDTATVSVQIEDVEEEVEWSPGYFFRKLRERLGRTRTIERKAETKISLRK